MCLCFQPYRHNTSRCLDDPVPPGDAGHSVTERLPKGSDMMTDNLGLTYVAIRNCDLDRFSVK